MGGPIAPQTKMESEIIISRVSSNSGKCLSCRCATLRLSSQSGRRRKSRVLRKSVLAIPLAGQHAKFLSTWMETYRILGPE